MNTRVREWPGKTRGVILGRFGRVVDNDGTVENTGVKDEW